MGNFQIPNLAMSAKNLQKTVEPNHEGMVKNDHWPWDGNEGLIESDTQSLKMKLNGSFGQNELLLHETNTVFQRKVSDIYHF